MVGLTIAHQRIEEHLALVVNGKIVLTADAETVETATQCQTLKTLTVDGCEIDALSKIVNVLIGTVLLTLLYDGLCSRVAHALNGTETETNLTMMVHTELLVRLIHIRSQRGDTHRLTLVHQFRDFRNLVATATHDGSHKLCGIVGLQISRLVGHPGIAGGM